MPRFYLDIRKDGQIIRDQEGVDFPDIEAAVEEAKASARDMIAEKIRANEPPSLESAFEIIDGGGATLRTVPFWDSLHADFGTVVRK